MFHEKSEVENEKFKERFKDTEKITADLARFKADPFKMKPEAFSSITILDEALMSYWHGLYRGAIINSATAIEVCLYILISKKPDQLSKNEVKNFKNLIKHAVKLEILDSEHEEKASKLRKLRNLYAHHINLLYLMKKKTEQLPDFGNLDFFKNEKIRKMAKEESIQQVAAKILEKPGYIEQLIKNYALTVKNLKKIIDTIPDVSWAISTETKEFYSTYSEKRDKMIRESLSSEGVMKVLDNLSTMKIPERTATSKSDALECLQLAYEILVSLKIIE